MFKVDNRNTRKKCEICSKLSVFIVNFEQPHWKPHKHSELITRSVNIKSIQILQDFQRHSFYKKNRPITLFSGGAFNFRRFDVINVTYVMLYLLKKIKTSINLLGLRFVFYVICDALRDLIPFVQFKNHGKHSCRSVAFSK